MMIKIKREVSSNRKTAVLLIVMVIVLLLMVAVAHKKYQFSWLDEAAVGVLAPVQGAVYASGAKINNAVDAVYDVLAVYEQNKQLKRRLDELNQIQVRINEVAAENQRLSALLAYKSETKQFDLVVAKVVARDLSSWTDTMTINRGSQDGIKKDMAVVNSQGLIGNVVSVFDSASRVQLIVDPRSSVGSLVQRADSRTAGIVEGTSEDKTTVRMVNIPRDSLVDIGDLIVTSGFGGIYPKGITVGAIKSVHNQEGGLLKYAIVQPAVDFRRIEEVAVIVNTHENVPALPAGNEVKR